MEGWTDSAAAPEPPPRGVLEAVINHHRSEAKARERLESQLTEAREDDPNAALLKACRGGSHHMYAIARAIEAGANINAADEWGYTPLHEVAKVGGVEAAELLLSMPEHTGPNAADSEGYTPLHGAARAGSVKMVQLLLASQADVNARSTQARRTPLDLAHKHGHAAVAAAMVADAAHELRGVAWTEHDALQLRAAKATAATAGKPGKKGDGRRHSAGGGSRMGRRDGKMGVGMLLS